MFKKWITQKGKKEKHPASAPLKEGVDFYIDNGYYVFTAVYLTNRGYCCSNGCRHCPYKGNNQPENVEKS
jgi:2-iminoacetate synthase ThiH